ncbi:hypothetical protein BKA82DRAFT_718922 [Pisolithus tinctorius]|uniref:Uncharacterized protein n=1 Tax=Pisolithus tinctorius Marx 270 TaxID=870435 RepID=A0A0C3JX30_PISTI|nr:hypothetical protein BKA82DRAFT_718922 [Pisolithus tinctorius]KIO01957.1 hypothetical protein M404DRAFT_718922 [Pisolithus tinctorius Marx 270]
MPAGRWAVLGFLVHPLLIFQLGSACLLYHTWGVPRGDFTSAVFQKLSRMQASPATSGTTLIPSALSLHHVQGPQFPVILSVYFPELWKNSLFDHPRSESCCARVYYAREHVLASSRPR